ncbi:MAG TPA: amino acid adenylation domain-containing protein [Herpetosiphonaceae bacterium]
MSDVRNPNQETTATPATNLQRWRQLQAARADAQLPHCDTTQPLPLSFAQERIWFLHQMFPDSAGYHLPIGFRLVGKLDRSCLEQSLGELRRRHAILRTTFHEVSGKPAQVIGTAAEIALSCIDLRHLAPAEREQELQRRATEAYEQPFDLMRGALIRPMLFLLDENEHLLLITLHHIVSDGWSNGILLKELGEIYAALTAGQRSPLPEPAYQFAEIAAWERQRFERNALEPARAYWTVQLAGSQTVLQLPTDRPRPTVPTSAGAVYRFQLPAPLLTGLQEVCQREHITLVMALLSALKILLYRYTDQSDLSIGLPVLNRQRREAEGLIGIFVNTLVLRTDLSGNPSFQALLRRVRDTALQAYQHQSYPFEKLVDALQITRDPSSTPLFQVMLSIGAGAESDESWPGLTLHAYEVERRGANFDLTLEVTEHSDGLHCAFVYRADLFEAATVERMARHFCALLEAGVAQPETPIELLPLLSQPEQRQILEDWNATQVVYPQAHCLHQLVEEQAERTPDAVAVSFEARSREPVQLTYRQLNQRANQLAHFLIARGVGQEMLVGIAAERSLELVIGLLGVLKAGAAYVPLDPTYPPDRLAYMLQDSNVAVLLTQERLLGERIGLPASGATVVCLDRDWTRIAEHAATSPTVDRSPDHLAYMIYTSGSTGKPKGALNTHRGIVNRLLWMQAEYGLTAADRVLQKTPFSFDVSVWEFFWPLITGARLVVARPDGHKDPAYLVEIIQREAITTLHFVPSMLQVFLDEPGVAGCASLKRVICSGEALPYDLQERFFARSGAELHNLYGPTEAAVDVTYWACERGSTRRMVPLGRPVANTEIYILDRHLQPVPIGVGGELHIGGVQVGRGYLNQPELTAAKFITDPFHQRGDNRLYKTGDLARFLPDGTIEYLGRIDHQVKLRGLRIELGEIEAVLAQHPVVREAVVVAREYAPGDLRLVAYVVESREPRTQNLEAEVPDSTSPGGHPALGSALRSFLAEQLPEYMLPSAYVLVEALPLSPNGKIDRRALPEPETTASRGQREFVAPQNAIEREITAIWQNVLQTPQVSVLDNFFELGGNSLLVIQVRAHIQERLGFELSIVDAFRHTTVQTLAAHISRGARPAASAQPILDRAERQRQFMQRRRVERR